MKKLTFIILLGVMACSCDKNIYDDAYRSKVLDNFATTLHNYVICDPVKVMIDLDRSSGDKIFEPAFHCEKEYSDGKVTVDLSQYSDSTWIVSGSYSKTLYCSEVIMTGRDSVGLCSWKCTGSGSYDEDDGYSAKLWNEESASFSWSKVITAASVSYKLHCDSKYLMETYKEGKTIKQLSRSVNGEVSE